MKQIWDLMGGAEDVAVADTALETKLFTEEGEYGDEYVAVPFIQLYDDDVYTSFYKIEINSKGDAELTDLDEKWLQLNK